MDPVLANQISEKLKGRHIGGWFIGQYLGSGKSAVVFEGEKDNQKAALKVFDPELVERFGKATQLARIQRECQLIGEQHTNLVQIFDGGECEESGYLYVAMELIDAPNLSDSLTSVPSDKIAGIIEQIASAAKFLEEKQLAHRDIKPENIVVLPDFSRAVLLDLGVLRPFGDPSLTDEDARIFVGTLRYSSPEFLLRAEEDNINGWRALTFYQLGAVLHDLIMGRPLFIDFSEPYAMLVEAVKNEKPVIRAEDVHPDLVLLAQNCLVKPPDARISLVSWSDFTTTSNTRRPSDGTRERVKKRALAARMNSNTVAPIQTQKQIAQQIANHLDKIIRDECTSSNSFPPLEIIKELDRPVQVRVKFSTSTRHSLSQHFSIRFDCELVDEATMALILSVSAGILTSGEAPYNPPLSVPIFRGSLESNVFTNHVQNVLWYSLDLAQQPITLGANFDVSWLDLTKILEDL